MEIDGCMETIKSIFYVQRIIQSSIIQKTVCMQRNRFIIYVTNQMGAFKDAVVSAELEPAIMTYPFLFNKCFLFSLCVLKCRYRQVYLCFWKPNSHYTLQLCMFSPCKLSFTFTVYCLLSFPGKDGGYLYISNTEYF